MATRWYEARAHLVLEFKAQVHRRVGKNEVHAVVRHGAEGGVEIQVNQAERLADLRPDRVGQVPAAAGRGGRVTGGGGGKQRRLRIETSRLASAGGAAVSAGRQRPSAAARDEGREGKREAVCGEPPLCFLYGRGAARPPRNVRDCCCISPDWRMPWGRPRTPAKVGRTGLARLEGAGLGAPVAPGG